MDLIAAHTQSQCLVVHRMLSLALGCHFTRLGCVHDFTWPRMERLWDAIDCRGPNERTMSCIGHLSEPQLVRFAMLNGPLTPIVSLFFSKLSSVQQLVGTLPRRLQNRVTISICFALIKTRRCCLHLAWSRCLLLLSNAG